MRKFILCINSMILMLVLALPTWQVAALEKIDKNLLAMGLDSQETVGVFVQLDKPTVVMMATFGGEKVFQSDELMKPGNIQTRLCELSLKRFQDKSMESVRKISPNSQIGQSYQYAFNGYYLETRLCDIEKIASLPGIKKIRYILDYKLDRTKTRALLGAEKVWNTVKDPSGRVVDGSGVVVSVVDTGLDYTHPDFGSQKKPVGDKVLYSHDWSMKDDDCQEEIKTLSEHGTACASLVAGDGPDNPKTKVKEKGIAPKAKLAGYKIQKVTDNGRGYILDRTAIMNAWESNIKEKIDISSNSWGRPGGDPQFEEEQLNCALAGCTVVVSNGNEGSPGAYRFPVPQGQTASANSVIGVGATDETEISELVVKSAPDESVKDKKFLGSWGNTGKKISSFEVPYELIDCGWGRIDDFKNLDVKGKVALIQRGPKDGKFGTPLSFKDKVLNAAFYGAKAVILYNNTYGQFKTAYHDPKANEKLEDIKLVPSYEITMNEGLEIANLLHFGHEHELGIPDTTQNSVTISFAKPRYFSNIAEYSSNGPTVLGFLKPDVCAPGIDIHAALPYFLREKTKNDYMEDFGGTSAACPFVAGCAALIRQGRPNWNPFEIKRSLMNTATMLKRTDGQYYLPFTQQGMGRANVDEAIKTPVLIQPPSALIVAKTGKINIADRLSELEAELQSPEIPAEVVSSTVPLKLTNYSNKAVVYNISIEINSGTPQQFDVTTTTTDVTVPPAGKTPGSAWIGINVKLPYEVQGSLNDIIVWFTDKVSNKRLHTGICVYNNDPKVGGDNNSFITNLKFSRNSISPNGDGIDDSIEVTYDVTNGTWDWQWDPPLWNNYGNMLVFYALDNDGQSWTIIHVEEKFELGPGKFTWDGRDIGGEIILPDGEWNTSIAALCIYPDKKGEKLIQDYIGFDMPVTFSMIGSPAPTPPMLSIASNPYEPAVGQSFSVSVYLTGAKDVKSLQFKLSIPGGNDMVSYTGFAKGDFIVKDEPMAVASVDYSDKLEQFTVDFDRPVNGVTGDGLVLTLNFIAKEANYMDLKFSDVVMNTIDKTGKPVKSKVMKKNGEVAILQKPVSPADVNRDGVVDTKDLAIMNASMNTQDGQPGYNWRCDLNFDHFVNMEDFALFSKSYITK